MRLPDLCQICRGILPENPVKGTGESWPVLDFPHVQMTARNQPCLGGVPFPSRTVRGEWSKLSENDFTLALSNAIEQAQFTA
jgi:hypothetical protein